MTDEPNLGCIWGSLSKRQRRVLLALAGDKFTMATLPFMSFEDAAHLVQVSHTAWFADPVLKQEAQMAREEARYPDVLKLERRLNEQAARDRAELQRAFGMFGPLKIWPPILEMRYD